MTKSVRARALVCVCIMCVVMYTMSYIIMHIAHAGAHTHTHTPVDCVRVALSPGRCDLALNVCRNTSVFLRHRRDGRGGDGPRFSRAASPSFFRGFDVSRAREISVEILSHFRDTYIIPRSAVGSDRHIASAATTLTSGFR